MKLLKYILIILLAMLLIGCNVLKDKHLSKQHVTEQVTKQNDIVTHTQTTTERYRPGGEIKTTILPEAQREHDKDGNIKELIQELKDGALTKTVIYKPDGSVDVDCTADAVWEKILQKQEEYDNSKISGQTETETETKDKTKTEKVSAFNILYVFIGLVLLMVVNKLMNKFI